MTPDDAMPQTEGDEPFFTYLDLLDDCSGWAFEVWDTRLGEGSEQVFQGEAESVDHALAEVRRIIAGKLNVDEGAFEVDMLARLDEVHARMIDGAHNVARAAGERPSGRPSGRHRRPPR